MRTPGISVVAVVVWASATGCAAQSPSYEKKLSELRDKVTILQNQRDRLEERLAAVEQQQKWLLTQRAPVAERVSRPPLKVVVLKPDVEREPGQPRSTPEAPASDLPGVALAPDSSVERPLLSGEGKQLRITGEQP